MDQVKVISRPKVKSVKGALVCLCGDYDKVQEETDELKKELFCFLAECRRRTEGLGQSGLENKMAFQFQGLQGQKTLSTKSPQEKSHTKGVVFYPLLRP